MPQQGSLPSFNKGDRLKASSLQSLSDAINRARSTPGSFFTGAFSVTRKLSFGGAAVGASSLRFGMVPSGGSISAATSWAEADYGTGTVDLKTGDGVFGESVTVSNELFDSVGELIPVFVELRDDGEYYLVKPGCNPGPEIIEE